MSIYSRDYMRDGSQQRPGSPSTWNVVTWLLVINLAVFLINLISAGRIGEYLGLSWRALSAFRIWTPLTYQFTHLGLLHLAGNMLGLFFLGRLLMGIIGPAKLVRVYLLGGLLGGFLQIAFQLALGIDANIIGASGAVLAILAATAALLPHQKFQLLIFFVLPISMTLRTLLWISIGVNLVSLIMSLTGQGGGIAVMAHFGGMLFGWAYIKYWFNGTSTRPAGKRFPIRILKDSDSPGKIRKKREKKKKAFVSTDVDAILDKINEKGFQSLTDEEKQQLEKSSERLSKRVNDSNTGKHE
ncbi:MAG: rhomboid family intramembrane serine protease [Verrucomicrobiales bacterium]|nr:rhomboid family intramembrane serine protease [Verrucomicrobiales bacterium]